MSELKVNKFNHKPFSANIPSYLNKSNNQSSSIQKIITN